MTTDPPAPNRRLPRFTAGVRNVKRRSRAAFAVLAMALLAAAPAPAAESYPDRPITVIIPFAKGGGTDTTGRAVAKLLSAELGVEVTVVNLASRAGVDGHRALARAAPDGYTLGIMTSNIWLSSSNLKPQDFTGLAKYNADYAALHVDAASRFTTADDLVASLRDNPDMLRAGGATKGGIWHVAFVGLLNDLGLEANDVTLLPTNSAAVAFRGLLAGQVDVVLSSVPEAETHADGDAVRTLAVLGPERSLARPDVPTIEQATGRSWDYIGDWRGLAAPANLPDEVRETLLAALRRLHESGKLGQRMRAMGFSYAWEAGRQFQETIRTFRSTAQNHRQALGLNR
jgi:tripartite-type tricarboxylate transporter receptor subunit TctC